MAAHKFVQGKMGLKCRLNFQQKLASSNSVITTELRNIFIIFGCRTCYINTAFPLCFVLFNDIFPTAWSIKEWLGWGIELGVSGFDSWLRETFSFPSASRPTLGPSFLTRGYQGHPSRGIQRLGCESNHPPPYIAEVKALRYTSTSPYVFIAWFLAEQRNNINISS